MKTDKSKRVITISDATLAKLSQVWYEYLAEHPHKYFILEGVYKSSEECLDLIEDSKGFQITAFAGKAQNSYTHPDRLPDLGDLNLLARIRAIQIRTQRPIRIVLDGRYYADIFGEEQKYIRNYEDKLERFAKYCHLNKEFPEAETFMTVSELINFLKLDTDKFKNIINSYRANPSLAYDDIEIYPQDLLGSVNRMLPDKIFKKMKYSQLETKLLEISSEFIIKKASLSKLVNLSKMEEKYQRVTILRYSKTKNPRINLEMNLSPWNSTILFKGNFQNINTATNNSYQTLSADKRNFKILDEKNEFLGFTRSPKIISRVL